MSSAFHMPQVRVLQEAITEAQSGRKVLVTGKDVEHANRLRRAAEEAVPILLLQSKVGAKWSFKSGGELHFRDKSVLETKLPMANGLIYVVRPNTVRHTDPIYDISGTLVDEILRASTPDLWDLEPGWYIDRPAPNRFNRDFEF